MPCKHKLVFSILMDGKRCQSCECVTLHAELVVIGFRLEVLHFLVVVIICPLTYSLSHQASTRGGAQTTGRGNHKKVGRSCSKNGRGELEL